VQRYLFVAAGLVLAAAAIWHPPAQQGAIVADRPSPSMRLHRAPPSNATRVLVYVAGEVARPGLYRLASGARVADAIRSAGGTLPDADPLAVNLAASVADGDEVAVVARGAAIARRTRTRTPRSRLASRRDPPAEASVDPNVADAQTLARVPGIGPAIASRIVALRASDGPFASADQLLDVAGMTPARLDRATPFLVFAER
jgi:competence protein ComEA